MSNQSRHFCDGIKDRQIKLSVPTHKLLTTTDTCPTRWNNQHNQMKKNCVMRPITDHVFAKLARRNEIVELVEDSFNDSGVRFETC